MPKGVRGFQKGNTLSRGKQKKTIEKEMALEEMRKEILKEWKPLIDVKMALAKGIKMVSYKLGKDTPVIYEKAPDGNSIEYLISMVVGKPKESLEVEGKIELEATIQQVISKVYGHD